MLKIPLSVLIIESHALMRSALVTALEEEPDLTVIAATAEGNKGVLLFGQHRPDVVVINLALPDTDGLSTIEKITTIEPRAKILVITNQEERASILAVLEAGALGYFPKSAERSRLIDAVRSVAEGICTIYPLALP